MSVAKKVPPLRFKGFDGEWERERLGDSFSLREEHNSDGRETKILSVVKDIGVILYSEKGNLGNRAKDDVTQYNIARKGDIVLNSMNVIIGSVGVSRYDGCISPAYYALRPLDKTDSKFWGYWFWRPEAQGLISSRACGMMEIRRKISTNDLLELEVFAPEKAEQVKIREVINSLEQVIENRSVAHEKLRSLKKAMLEKMFPRAGAKVPEVRFKGFEGEWEKKRLEGIAVFNPCCSLPDDFEYVDLESVIGTEMLSHRTEYRDTAPSRAQRLARVGDLFYQTVRPYQKNNYLFELDTLRPYVFSTGYAQLRPRCDGYFLMSAMQTDDFLAIVLQNCTGTSYPAISDTNLSLLSICLPSLLEQRKIGAYFRSLDALISARWDEIGKLKDLKKALLERMFV